MTKRERVVVAMLAVVVLVSSVILLPRDLATNRRIMKECGLFFTLGCLVGLVRMRRVANRFDRGLIVFEAAGYCTVFGILGYIGAYFLIGWPLPLGLASASVGGLVFLYVSYNVYNSSVY